MVKQFDREVRYSPKPVLRQKNMRYEINRFTDDGFLENPIVNIQDMQTGMFGGFKSAALDMLTGRAVADMTSFPLRRAGLPGVAPVLAKGDVPIWNSLTIYGSFSAERSCVSRRSLTARYLRASDGMLQFHTRVRRQELLAWNGMPAGLLHDQDRWRNRLVRDIAHRLPVQYASARKLALQALLASRRFRARGQGDRAAGARFDQGACNSRMLLS